MKAGRNGKGVCGSEVGTLGRSLGEALLQPLLQSDHREDCAEGQNLAVEVKGQGCVEMNDRSMGAQEVQISEQVGRQMAVQAGHIQRCEQTQAEAPETVSSALPVNSLKYN